MKVGGNQSFAEWLTKHPSHSSSTDIKDKYTTKAATMYRDELQRRVAADEAIFGKGKVIIDGGVIVESAKPNDADFFDTWDNAPVIATKSLIPAANLMSFGGSAGTTPMSSQPGSRSVSPALSAGGTTLRTATPPSTTIPAAPRTVTSSSLRTSSVARVGTRTPSGTVAAGKGKPGSKLGVKKGGPAVNFEEAERKAKEEEERVKRLGYDSRLEAEAAAAAALIAKSASLSSGNTSRVNDSRKNGGAKDSMETERLGMGIKRLGFGQTTGVSGAESAKAAAAAEKLATRRANGYDDEPGSLRLCCPFSFSLRVN